MPISSKKWLQFILFSSKQAFLMTCSDTHCGIGHTLVQCGLLSALHIPDYPNYFVRDSCWGNWYHSRMSLFWIWFNLDMALFQSQYINRSYGRCIHLGCIHLYLHFSLQQLHCSRASLSCLYPCWISNISFLFAYCTVLKRRTMLFYSILPKYTNL